MKRVSVIVPVFNVEKYLQKCLDSLVNQTLRDLEIIIVDDGSFDESSKIISQYTQDYPEIIRSFYKPNGGLSEARNFGLERATGEYIGFVDGDDYVSEKMFEELLNLAIKHDAELVICDLQKVDENGEVLQDLKQIPNLPERINLENDFSVFSDLSYFACNKLFKKELFKEKRFKAGAHFEDIQLIPQLLLDCKVIAHSPQPFYRYVERDGSITKNYSEKGLDILRAVEEVEKAFKVSKYSHHKNELKGFQILEGVYSFLAYLAFVKDNTLYSRMAKEFSLFRKERKLSFVKILTYKRFGKNYLLSLPSRKKIYYLVYFSPFRILLRKII